MMQGFIIISDSFQLKLINCSKDICKKSYSRSQQYGNV